MVDLKETENELQVLVPAPSKNRPQLVSETDTAHPAEPDIALLKRLLDSRDQQIVALQHTVRESESRARLLSDEVSALSARLDQVKRERTAVNPTPRDDHQAFIAFFRSLALESAERDRDFKRLLARLDDPAAFPGHARAEVERRLAQTLGDEDRSSTLAEQIPAARLAGSLSTGGAELALVINTLGRTAGRHEFGATVWARCLLALYAAALIWPELRRRT